METKKRNLTINILSSAIGASLGATSGSKSLIVVIGVAITFATLSTWAINGMIK